MKLWARSGFEWADNLSGLWSPVLTNATGLTLLDSSTNGSDDGTLTNYSNVNTAWQQTKAGMSVNFSGTTYALPQKTRSIFPLGFSARTMACWFVHTTGNSQEIMAYGGNSGSGQRLGLWTQLSTTIGVEILGYGYQVDYTRNSEPRFLVATLNGLTSTLTSACRIFLDGTEGTNYQTFGSAVAIDTRNTGMTFGTISGAPNNNNFNGRILEAWILPSELNAGQILSAYQAGPRGMFDFQPRRRRSFKGFTLHSATSNLSNVSSLSADAKQTLNGASSLNDLSALTAVTNISVKASANLSSSVSIIANGSKNLFASANLNIQSTSSSVSILYKNASASLATESSFVGTTEAIQDGIAILTSEAAFSALSGFLKEASSSFSNITTFFSNALTIPPSSCQPPYCLGTGDYCGCSCNCCPPCPCYTSWTLTYQCGSPAASWYDCPETPEPKPSSCEPRGCDCISINTEPGQFFLPEVSEFPDFPDFNQSYADEFEFEALDAPSPSCSIPCATYTITITTSGCCMYGDVESFGGQGSITLTSVGAGQVCVSGPSNTTCGPFVISVNGVNASLSTGCASVSDCDTIDIKIDLPVKQCCSCCLINVEGTLLGDCQVQALRKALNSRKRIVTTSAKKSLSRKNLKDRMSKIKF